MYGFFDHNKIDCFEVKNFSLPVVENLHCFTRTEANLAKPNDSEILAVIPPFQSEPEQNNLEDEDNSTWHGGDAADDDAQENQEEGP